jgi:hypothetical protein
MSLFSKVVADEAPTVSVLLELSMSNHVPGFVLC